MSSDQISHEENTRPAVARTAVIVIDVQNAMFETTFEAIGAAHDAPFVVRRICALIDRARREEAQIVFVQHDGGPGSPREHGSEGWRLITAMRPQFPDWVVEKAGPSIFAGTNLAAQLKAVGIRRLILAGVSSDGCIEASCHEAAERGFEVVLASDAHTSRDSDQTALAAIPAHVVEAGEVALA
ncbi:MAG: isochorismatase family protein [Asticcacaulis sp.]